MKQLRVICFDIHDDKRLRNVAIILENHGKRVQYSIFECHLTKSQLTKVIQQLTDAIDTTQDNIRAYTICPKDEKKIQLHNDIYQSKKQEFYIS